MRTTSTLLLALFNLALGTLRAEAQCSPYFYYSTSYQPDGVAYTFTPVTTVGVPMMCQWDFGNGQQSSEISPTVVFPCSESSFLVSVFITTDLGCSEQYNEYVYHGTSNPLIGGNTTVSNACVECDGQIAISGTGGSGNYTYSFFAPSTFGNVYLSSGSSIGGRCKGNYYGLVYDQNTGCRSDSLLLQVGGLDYYLESNLYGTIPCGTLPTMGVIDITGGQGPFYYLWSGAGGSGGTGATSPITQQGVKQVRVSDSAGCRKTKTKYTDAYLAPNNGLRAYHTSNLFPTNSSASLPTHERHYFYVTNESCSDFTGPIEITIYDQNVAWGSLDPYISALWLFDNCQGCYTLPSTSYSVAGGETYVYNNVSIVQGSQVVFRMARHLLGGCIPHSETYRVTAGGYIYQESVFAGCSQDPNDKLVDPPGEGPEGYIGTDSDTLLSYTVRFQNTGSAAAFYVRVRDTLDANLDLSTFRVIGSSHEMFVEMVDTNVVDFIFWGINLPDSTSDEPGSHGHIRYTVRPYPGLPIGTQITNAADIYFDYNDPIRTNTTYTTIDELTSTTDMETSSLMVFPNPTDGRFMVQTGQSVELIQVFDSMGRMVHSQRAVKSGTQMIDLSGEAKGIYTIRLAGPEDIRTGRVIIN